MPRLYLLSGPDLGKSFDVAHGATLGRSPDCTVHLRDTSVSRVHARLELQGSAWTIVDADSRNGLTVAGERVPSAVMTDGDEFTLGEVLVRFRADAPAARPPVVHAPTAADAEIELEGEWSTPHAPPPAPRVATVPSVPTRAPTPALGARRENRAPSAAADRSRDVLQYKRVAPSAGLLSADLAQFPAWVRLGAFVVALAIAAALFFVAFRGIQFLKGRGLDRGSAAEGSPSTSDG